MNGWRFVSSTSWSDFDNGIVQNVRNAYMVVVEEALKVILAVENIMHAFVCGGVGSIAAAVFLSFFTRFSRI
ncbi:diaminopropionate ammonia-lyase [Fusarium oxysporum f. sp. melonis 26406]|uniref:Diaminopropionate ammonia-lyase n=1 Tax=Fusarium oxysporum f. sp. melonis 26406 TaxID=1089452 RepID=X0A4B1_FUSOX|nr:diaminopropionate ammonia-lyase [Fusarium oxysporum f. sp. melonis 26406]